MKFYINRPNTKKARNRERKKKRRNKSPLKHFSGLKKRMHMIHECFSEYNKNVKERYNGR